MYNLLYCESSHWKKQCALNDKIRVKINYNGPFSVVGHDVSSGET